MIHSLPHIHFTMKVFCLPFTTAIECSKLETFSISREFLFMLPNEPNNVYKLNELVTNVFSRF